MRVGLARAVSAAVLAVAAFQVLGAPAKPVFSYGHAEGGTGRIAFPLTAGDGMMYGVSGSSDTSVLGSVFGVDSQGVFTIYRFNTPPDGGANTVPLVRGTDGAFYGATGGIGLGDPPGQIYRLWPSGQIDTVHLFNRDVDQGLHGVHADLVPDGGGGWYGVGYTGLDPLGPEVLFQLSAAGGVSILHTFTDTGLTVMNLIRLGDGTLLGTRSVPNGVDPAEGYVFSYRPGGALYALHYFDAQTEGAYPRGELAISHNGSVYGTLRSGGPAGGGSVWRYYPHSAFSIVHAFGQQDPLGYDPDGVSTGANGYVYSVTDIAGTLFALSTEGTTRVLHRFDGECDPFAVKPCYPTAAPSVAQDGGLWGATSFGGVTGSIYRFGQN